MKENNKDSKNKQKHVRGYQAMWSDETLKKSLCSES